MRNMQQVQQEKRVSKVGMIGLTDWEKGLKLLDDLLLRMYENIGPACLYA